MNESYFGTILDNSHHLYFIAEPESMQILLANSGAARFTGFSSADLEQAYLQDIILDFESTTLHEILERQDDLPSPSSSIFLKIRSVDGPACWSRAFVEAIEFQNKQAVCLTLIPSDADSQQTLEREKSLARAFQRMKMFNWSIDIANGDRMSLDEGFEHFGIDLGDGNLSFTHILKNVHEDDRDELERTLCDMKNGTALSSVEFRIFHVIYGWIWAVTNLERETDGRGELIRINGTLQDITERKVTDDVRRNMSKQMQEAQKYESLGMLAGGIAHEFNNILTGILGNASLARMQLDPGSSMETNLEQIETSAIRAAELCKQMLAYAGKGKYFVESLNLNNVLHDSKQLLRLSVNKAVLIEFQLAESLPKISADPTQLRQIILNLVTNASESIGNSSGMVQVSSGLQRILGHEAEQLVYAPPGCAGDYVYLEVRDNGSGLTPAAQEKMFDPFFTTKPAGRGLGLAAALGIVRAHQGAIQVSSELGVGTTVRILFPALDKVSPVGPVTQSKKVPVVERTVLVVDDEETVATVTARMLESFGFKTLVVSSGRYALEAYASEPNICAVILDLTMPKMSGVQTYRALKELDADVKVLLMSGFTEQEAMQQFSDQGIAGFLQKPFTPAELKKMLLNFLDI